MDTRTDNKESQMEPAEGSRENVNIPVDPSSGGSAGAPMERGEGQVSQPEKPLPGPGGRQEPGDLPKDYPSADRDDAGGVTNRPLSEEKRNQRAVPDRGQTKKA